MHRLTVLLPLALMACAVPPGGGGFREVDRAIYSTAVLEPARLAGRWYQVADFVDEGAAACRAGGVMVEPRGDGTLGLKADLCLAGRKTAYGGVARVSGPGRMVLEGADPAGIGAEWWVLWVDTNDRTLVVGTPGGGFGMILNRTPDLPPDRMRAAREILEWNGYDIARLRPVSTP